MPRDIQRPLEESQPVAATPGLRPAAPADVAMSAAVPATQPAPATEPVPATEPMPAAPPTPTAPAVRRTWHPRNLDLRSLPGRAWRGATATGRRSAAATRRWSRSPAGRLTLPTLLIGGLLAAGVTTGGFVIPQAGAGSAAPSTPAPSGAPGAPSAGAPPTGAPPPNPSTAPTGPPQAVGLPSDVLRGWAQQMSARTGVPAVALQAYGYAELVLSETRPGCQLSWTTLAAIGRVESNHGHAGASTLGPDGRALPEIIGEPLDGEGGRELIEDTDGGALDGDPIYDRAVGPMQFIPETWEREQVDATGDGVADPHNIHDSALAAANYLCNHGRDLSNADDWWAAVLAYNNVRAYADDVFAAASDYGQRSHG